METSTNNVAGRADNLALLFQEVLTVIERFRSGNLKQAPVETFRSRIKKMIEEAEGEALRRGYTKEDVRVAIFAIVTFLDESILNFRSAAFADWQRKPLQEEMFGVFEGGEIFFRNVDRLLGRADSEALADLLEVHQLCLLLGFRGRFSASTGNAEIRSLLQQIEEKIRRIRGQLTKPAWQPPPQIVAPAADRWIPIMKWAALGCCALALLLFVIFKVSLGSTVSDLGTLASRIFS